MPIRFDAKARAFAKQTGLDKLGQEKLKQLDKNGDGVVTITDARRLVRAAGLDKDGVLSREDRQKIDAALGGKVDAKAPAVDTPRGPSSTVASRVAGKKTLGATYMDVELKTSANGLSISMKGGLWNDGGAHTGVDKNHKALLGTLSPNAVDILFYGTDGSTGMPRSGGNEGGTAFGGGMLVAVADKKNGIMLVDIAARDFLDGKAPPQRQLVSNRSLASDPVLKKAAKKAGLDSSDLSVELKGIDLSAAFKDSDLNTLVFSAKVTDKNGKSRTLELSTYLEGNLGKDVAKLKIDALELGVVNSWGYLLPPSAKPAKADTTGTVDNGGGSHRGGGSENTTPVAPHRGGGGENSSVSTSSSTGGTGGGGE